MTTLSIVLVSSLTLVAACGDDGATTGDASTRPPDGLDGGRPTSTDGDTPTSVDGGATARTDGGTSVSRIDGGPSTSGTIFVARDYETEDPEHLFVEPVGSSRYVVGGGFGGSNAWEIHLNGDNGNEDHVGWISADIPESTTDVMFVGYMLYVSAGMVSRMEHDGVSGKMLDAHMHPWDTLARQTVIWRYWDSPVPGFADTGATGIVPLLLKGGAGGNFVRQLGPRQFDLRDYPDTWLWMEIELNARDRYTALWIRTPDGVFAGAQASPLMQRFADVPADWQHEYYVEEPYVYYAAGWQGPGLQWGYWDDLEGVAFTEADFVRLDDLVVSDAWIEPPF